MDEHIQRYRQGECHMPRLHRYLLCRFTLQKKSWVFFVCLFVLFLHNYCKCLTYCKTFLDNVCWCNISRSILKIILRSERVSHASSCVVDPHRLSGWSYPMFWNLGHTTMMYWKLSHLACICSVNNYERDCLSEPFWKRFSLVGSTMPDYFSGYSIAPSCTSHALHITPTHPVTLLCPCSDFPHDPFRFCCLPSRIDEKADPNERTNIKE